MLDGIKKGSLVDFGSYGKNYIILDTDYSDDYYWISDIKNDVKGWTILKSLAEKIIRK